MNNLNKRDKSKGKPKVVAKPRGYYYSSVNVNKRKEMQKQFNNNNMKINENNINTNEDFFSNKNIKNNNISNFNNTNNNTNININNDHKNNLELYNKNNLLLNYIENERKEFNIVLKKLKLINYCIGGIILKPKIKNFEINKKLLLEKEKREQEEINFTKNISDKIDSAINKANMALDNIRYLGIAKSSNSTLINNNNNYNMGMNINTNNDYNFYEIKKEKEKRNLINLTQRCLEKYVDNIEMNNSNHDEYFITISKQRKLFKDAKEQLQSAKYRLRNAGSFFDDIFKNKNNNKNKINSYPNKENITLIILNKEIFFRENIFIRINSFLKSEIFQKLFVKVLYNDNFIENINNKNIKNSYALTNNDVYNIFSLWIIIKDILNLFNQVDNHNMGISFINKNLNEKNFNDNKENNNLEFSSLNNYIFKNNIFDVIEKYLLFLNRRNNSSVNFDENKIFSQDYHKLYEIIFKLEQSKIAQFIQNNIENNNISINQNIITNTKEELNYFRNIQSIFENKGKYLCSIINK